MIEIKENGKQWFKFYLPTRYSTIWSKQDIEDIISGRQKYYLVKHGVFPETGNIILRLERVT
jgi:hypothetical protein